MYKQKMISYGHPNIYSKLPGGIRREGRTASCILVDVYKRQPLGKQMGHAGAIISGTSGSAKEKIEALVAAGMQFAQEPSDIPALLKAAKDTTLSLIHIFIIILVDTCTDTCAVGSTDRAIRVIKFDCSPRHSCQSVTEDRTQEHICAVSYTHLQTVPPDISCLDWVLYVIVFPVK